MECVRVPKSKRKEYREAIKQCVAEKFARNGIRIKDTSKQFKQRLFGGEFNFNDQNFNDQNFNDQIL